MTQTASIITRKPATKAIATCTRRRRKNGTGTSTGVLRGARAGARPLVLPLPLIVMGSYLFIKRPMMIAAS